ncbi:hypothetical protein J2D73_18055 [Acetobacter sacchari]|uniref:Uncharacterized protein n=1 Tax=Acetobacter sacchari TaxID=2661687 RepID=A0ABS3M0L8_9PROT|nr:hypothetical protein [Acetobacter sacchari]MBO1361690.1 hypothetical protein [Acetobacter sacchari]
MSIGAERIAEMAAKGENFVCTVVSPDEQGPRRDCHDRPITGLFVELKEKAHVVGVLMQHTDLELDEFFHA